MTPKIFLRKLDSQGQDCRDSSRSKNNSSNNIAVEVINTGNKSDTHSRIEELSVSEYIKEEVHKDNTLLQRDREKKKGYGGTVLKNFTRQECILI